MSNQQIKGAPRVDLISKTRDTERIVQSVNSTIPFATVQEIIDHMVVNKAIDPYNLYESMAYLNHDSKLRSVINLDLSIVQGLYQVEDGVLLVGNADTRNLFQVFQLYIKSDGSVNTRIKKSFTKITSLEDTPWKPTSGGDDASTITYHNTEYPNVEVALDYVIAEVNKAIDASEVTYHNSEYPTVEASLDHTYTELDKVDTAIDQILDSLDTKVDKELKTGSTTDYKVLSDNNFTDANLASITELEQEINTKIEDAPVDGKEYVRKDSTWEALVINAKGHTVLDTDSNVLTDRTKLQFKNLNVFDDETTDTTVVEYTEPIITYIDKDGIEFPQQEKIQFTTGSIVEKIEENKLEITIEGTEGTLITPLVKDISSELTITGNIALPLDVNYELPINVFFNGMYLQKAIDYEIVDSQLNLLIPFDLTFENKVIINYYTQGISAFQSRVSNVMYQYDIDLSSQLDNNNLMINLPSDGDYTKSFSLFYEGYKLVENKHFNRSELQVQLLFTEPVNISDSLVLTYYKNEE